MQTIFKNLGHAEGRKLEGDVTCHEDAPILSHEKEGEG